MNDVTPTLGSKVAVERVDLSLRATVLSGAFFGHQHVEAAGFVAAFPTLAPAEAFAAWFGQHAALRLVSEPAACRAALDRDIAAIDALLGEQLDAILHHPRVQRFEGSWRDSLG